MHLMVTITVAVLIVKIVVSSCKLLIGRAQSLLGQCIPMPPAIVTIMTFTVICITNAKEAIFLTVHGIENTIKHASYMNNYV